MLGDRKLLTNLVSQQVLWADVESSGLGKLSSAASRVSKFFKSAVMEGLVTDRSGVVDLDRLRLAAKRAVGVCFAMKGLTEGVPADPAAVPDYAKKLCKRLEAKSFSRDKSGVQLPEYIWQVLGEFSQAVVAVGPPVAALVKQGVDLGEDAAPAAVTGGDAAPAPAKKRLAGHPSAASTGRSSKRSRHTAKRAKPKTVKYQNLLKVVLARTGHHGVVVLVGQHLVWFTFVVHSLEAPPCPCACRAALAVIGSIAVPPKSGVRQHAAVVHVELRLMAFMLFVQPLRPKNAIMFDNFGNLRFPCQ
jgi:hypothetical protein